jgi:hypothetical protein
MYAVHLATGHNLWCQSLRLATINNYLLHAAQLVLYFDPEARDPRKDEHGHFAVCLQKVRHEIKRWEDIPEKWEPYTAPMHMLLAAQAANQPRDGLLNVLLDWFTVMLAAGGRRGEWAQPKHKAALSSPALNERGDPQAFCLGDIQFLGAGRRRLTHDYALSRPDDVALVNVRWRTQKNGDHGQIILFARNSTNQHLDLGAAWLRIIDRFLRLLGPRTDTPLGIYSDPTSASPLFITHEAIQDVMRQLAIDVYGLDPIKDATAIRLWVAHSLRVGACIILQAMGFLPHEIQLILRWKSETWRDYTRNLVMVAQRHSQAVTDANTMPVF